MNDHSDMPAFPCVHMVGGVEFSQQGMSLRDWFAGQALAGLVASKVNNLTNEEAAKLIYDFADAMLTERTKRESQ